MPPLETMDRTDRAVLWAFVRWQGDGEPVVSSPVDVTVDCILAGVKFPQKIVDNIDPWYKK